MLQKLIHSAAVTVRVGEEVWRVGRRDSLGGKVSADVQISGGLAFLDLVMTRARFSHCLLLDADVLVQLSIARFKFTPYALDFLFHDGKFRFCCQ